MNEMKKEYTLRNEAHNFSRYEDLVDLLAQGYPYDIRDMLLEILPRVGPVIDRVAAQEVSSRDITTLHQLWKKIKGRREIQERLRELLKNVDRLVIIYFLSKF